VPFAPIEEAIAAIARGEIVVVVDDQDRENEGDLIMAAEFATPEKLAFFLSHTSGLICVPMTGDRLDQLGLPLMVSDNTESQRTAFTVTVDYRPGTTTGISAADRAATIRALIDPATRPEDLARPGHVLPLRYREGGVLKRAGHTEAAVDLARAAGLYPAGVLCEVVSADKTGMARLPELEAFAAKHGLKLVSIADLVRYRRQRDKLVRRVPEASARIPTRYGDFTCMVYESVLDGEQHLALVKGDVAGQENVLVRVHSECLTGDVFGSLRCDCGPQLDAAIRRIAEEGTGVVVYLRGHEGRGIGLAHKLRAYSLQERGRDTVDANVELGLPVDNREYGIGAQILVDLGVTTMRLMTNNPAKYGGLEGFGLDIVERVPLETSPNPENIPYLRAKRDRLGHLLGDLGAERPAGACTGPDGAEAEGRLTVGPEAGHPEGGQPEADGTPLAGASGSGGPGPGEARPEERSSRHPRRRAGAPRAGGRAP
jgi:3,4-dihydroxy 2-butanone 4-phosphate synthase/GTP cyclohydrolase II